MGPGGTARPLLRPELLRQRPVARAADGANRTRVEPQGWPGAPRPVVAQAAERGGWPGRGPPAGVPAGWSSAAAGGAARPSAPAPARPSRAAPGTAPPPFRAGQDPAPFGSSSCSPGATRRKHVRKIGLGALHNGRHPLYQPLAETPRARREDAGAVLLAQGVQVGRYRPGGRPVALRLFGRGSKPGALTGQANRRGATAPAGSLSEAPGAGGPATRSATLASCRRRGRSPATGPARGARPALERQRAAAGAFRGPHRVSGSQSASCCPAPGPPGRRRTRCSCSGTSHAAAREQTGRRADCLPAASESSRAVAPELPGR